MPEKKEIDTTTTVAQDLTHLDLSRLRSGPPKSSSTTNMLEFMQNKIAIKQLRQIDEDMDAEDSKKKLENFRLTQLYAQGLIPQQVPGQPQTSPADAVAKLFTNDQFMANLSTLAKETQERVIQSVIQAQMMQGAGGAGGMNQMVPFLMLMQQNQQKLPPPPSETITAKDLVSSMTEGMKLAQSNQQNQNQNPVQVFEAIQKIVQPLQQNSSDLQNKLIEAKLDALKEASQPMTLEKSVEVITMLQDKFGGHQQATETDVAIAQLTANTRLKEIELNLDAMKLATETKSDNMKWQQIGGLFTTVAGIAGPSVMNAMQSGVQAMANQPRVLPVQQHQPVQSQPQQISPIQRYAKLQCGNCGKTFDVASNPDGTWKTQATCPHCKGILEVDMGDANEASTGQVVT